MKIILYIRKDARKAGYARMHTHAEEEPNYDTPRVVNVGNEIREHLDKIIAKCEADGAFVYGDGDDRKNLKTQGTV